MPKITITFEEQGSAPVSVELSEETAAILDKFVQDQTESTTVDGETVVTPKYAGKADLFMKHTQQSLIEPLVQRYAAEYESEMLEQIKELEDQKKALEDSIRNKFAPKIVE